MNFFQTGNVHLGPVNDFMSSLLDDKGPLGTQTHLEWVFMGQSAFGLGHVKCETRSSPHSQMGPVTP